jgi:hypothetical protein
MAAAASAARHSSISSPRSRSGPQGRQALRPLQVKRADRPEYAPLPFELVHDRSGSRRSDRRSLEARIVDLHRGVNK